MATDATYPKRDAFFAHRFARLVLKSCAANEIGQPAALLIIQIAHTEDAARYSGPATFWNPQLSQTLGFASDKALTRARDRAVEAGWLHYHRPTKRSVGHYWVTIPEAYECYDDSPIEQPAPRHAPEPIAESVAEPLIETDDDCGGDDDTPLLPITVDFDPQTSKERPKNDSQMSNKRLSNDFQSGLLPNPVPNPLPLPVLGGWNLIRSELQDLGVKAPDSAISTARRNGWTSEHAAAVVAWVRSRPGAWLGFQIFQRFKLPAAVAPPDGWPPESEEYRQRQRVDSIYAQQQAENERRAAAVEARKANPITPMAADLERRTRNVRAEMAVRIKFGAKKPEQERQAT